MSTKHVALSLTIVVAILAFSAAEAQPSGRQLNR